MTSKKVCLPDGVYDPADPFGDGVVEGFQGRRLHVDLSRRRDAKQLLDEVRICGQSNVQEHVEAVL